MIIGPYKEHYFTQVVEQDHMGMHYVEYICKYCHRYWDHRDEKCRRGSQP